MIVCEYFETQFVDLSSWCLAQLKCEAEADMPSEAEFGGACLDDEGRPT